MKQQAYNVLCLGQPLVDKIVRVEEEDLAKLSITTKGGSQLLHNVQALNELWTSVTKLMQQKKLKEGYKPIIVPGGSCANTIKGIAKLGEKCAYIGKVGNDDMGKFYTRKMNEMGVTPLLTTTDTTATGECVCLITPDGERTMRTFLGAADGLNVSELNEEHFKGIKLLHTVGYNIYNKPLLIQAMRLAKENKAMVSIALGSYELVRAFKGTLIDILSKYVDIIFANEAEAKELYPGSAEDAVDYLATLSHIAVVTCGKKGCWIKSGEQKYYVPVKTVAKHKVVDTTGAGDVFASGFLYGYLQGYALDQCARLGCLAGRELVQVLGAELTEERWQYIKSCVSQNMFKVQDKNNLNEKKSVKEKKTVSLNYTGTQIQSIAV